jgi:hypothetical protein
MNKNIGLKEKMRIELATVAGLGAFVVVVIIMYGGFSLTKRLVLLTGGQWSELSLVDATVACFTTYLVALGIGLAVRWWLIYKWVALRGR